MAGMNLWLIAALLLALGFIPCGIVCLRARLLERLAAVEMASTLTILIIVLMAQGYHRASLYDLALAMAVLSFPAGIVFARFIERWL